MNDMELRHIIREELILEIDAKKKLEYGLNSLKKSGKLIAQGYKQEIQKYKITTIAVKKLIAGEKLTPKEKSVMRATITDMLVRAGIVALGTASAVAIAGGLSTGILKAILKKGIVNAASVVTEGPEITDEQALKLLALSIAGIVEKNKSEILKLK